MGIRWKGRDGKVVSALIWELLRCQEVSSVKMNYRHALHVHGASEHALKLVQEHHHYGDRYQAESFLRVRWAASLQHYNC